MSGQKLDWNDVYKNIPKPSAILEKNKNREIVRLKVIPDEDKRRMENFERAIFDKLCSGDDITNHVWALTQAYTGTVDVFATDSVGARVTAQELVDGFVDRCEAAIKKARGPTHGPQRLVGPHAH